MEFQWQMLFVYNWFVPFFLLQRVKCNRIIININDLDAKNSFSRLHIMQLKNNSICHLKWLISKYSFSLTHLYNFLEVSIKPLTAGRIGLSMNGHYIFDFYWFWIIEFWEVYKSLINDALISGYRKSVVCMGVLFVYTSA